MKITISATGNLKTYVPAERELELEHPVTLKELKGIAGVPGAKTVSYAVNGRVMKADYKVADSDQVKFLMVVGAG